MLSQLTGGVYKVSVVSFLFPSAVCGVIPLPEQLRYNHGNQCLCSAGLCELCCHVGRPLTGQIPFLVFLVFVLCGEDAATDRD